MSVTETFTAFRGRLQATIVLFLYTVTALISYITKKHLDEMEESHDSHGKYEMGRENGI